jgi:hypothetical protein
MDSARILGMTRRLFCSLTVFALLTIADPGAVAKASWPSRSTPLSSTLGWFKAINAHDRQQLLFYVAPSAQDQMGWARPSVAWSKFTDLHCKTIKTSSRSRTEVLCTFHESASPSEGNPDNFWDVYLRHASGGWLIYSYGQG